MKWRMCATPRSTATSRTSANSWRRSNHSNAVPNAVSCSPNFSNNHHLSLPPMIALKDNLPVIQLASGQVIAFEREWLVRSLARAAARAGYAKWWLAGHVAESVATYLHDQENVNVTPV